VARHRAQIRGRVLDIGCGTKPYRRLFPAAAQYIGTETNRTFTPGSRADVTAFGEALPFRTGTFDAVICTEVLEHVPEPGDFLREVFRVILPGGVLLLTTPQTWGLHEEPYDFYRYTKYGLEYLFRKAGFEIVEISPTTGTLGTVGQRLSSFFYYRLGGRTRALKPLAVVVCAGIQLAFAGADRLAGRHGDTINWIALGRRPA
jgi:SAM-dependent methyltransferase